MANISTYPIGTPSAKDLLAGTQLYTDDNGKVQNLTRNFSVANVAAFANSYSLGYTVYTALITQTGTDAPVATVLQNTTSGTFTYARTGGGDYTVTVSGDLFTVNKTIVFLNGGSSENNHDIAWGRASDTVINLNTHNSDGKFTAGSIEIRVYA